MRIPKSALTDIRNTAVLFGIAYGAQLQVAHGHGPITTHALAAGAIAAGYYVLRSEGPVVLKQLEPELAAAERLVARDVLPVLEQADPVAAHAVRQTEAAIASLAPAAPTPAPVAHSPFVDPPVVTK